MRRFALLAILALAPLGLDAARLVLRDGTTLNGRFISGTSQEIVFQDDSGVRRRYNVNRVQTLEFNDGVRSSQLNRGQFNDNNRYNDRTRFGAADRVDTGRYDNSFLTVPAGTSISVRTDEEINSDTARPGTTFSARITDDVLDTAGNLVIPRGTDASLSIRDYREGGTFSGDRFVLGLDSIRMNGRSYAVTAEDKERGNSQGIGANRRTAEMVGGGAALGTLLGALAGGGKGAAIGAIAGAVAGGGVQVATKGDRVRVPAETVLNFRLDENLTLRAR